MLKKRSDSTTFYCFSPPVMIITFIIEIFLAGYTLWRYKLKPISRVAVACLVFLALFQLSEYFVCETSSAYWSRIGFASITMLPPLGLHLMYILAKRPSRKLVWTAYATAALLVAYFLTYTSAFTGHACNGNYVIFQLGYRMSFIFGTFYYGWIAASLALGYRWRQTKDRAQKASITGLMVGYLVFLVPTIAVNTFFPETKQGIPSIMCGFAVLYAFILVGYILPKAQLSKGNKRK